jgi:MFS family permease
LKSTSINIVIVVAQFCGTSLWFAGNSILPVLTADYDWPPGALAWLVSATQLGFILGTLAFALLGLVDRFSPSKTFFVSTLAGAVANISILLNLSSVALGFSSRFVVGLCLAGIYPVGMKIAADWNKEGLGKWLGSLVGALVIGTAFPQAIKLFPEFLRPTFYFMAISGIAIAGAIVLYAFVGDGPYRKQSKSFSFKNVGNLFSIKSFRAPALGYFGHMWEVYAWWAFVPWVVTVFNLTHGQQLNVPLISFVAIGSGFIGCAGGGILSSKIGSFNIALYALIGSGLCCVLSVFSYNFSPLVFVFFLMIWGALIAGDSPQFSTLIAQQSPEHLRGSAITFSTCLGFTITIFSIQLLNYLQYVVKPELMFLFLLPGPVVGVLAMLRGTNLRSPIN